ncbi:MAG: phosphoribosylamine--glycine ligase [Candidatus Aenigmarchaeota archaeon]|nr:phosphoribosylamine--glycine ligase [Candidatus Aenigmarchaeota archaeon]
MKVLIVGNGGREHAMGWKIAQSPLVSELYFAPGNGGTSLLGENIPVPDSIPLGTDQPEFIDFLEYELEEKKFTENDMVVIGPDMPLAFGIVDRLSKYRVYGPNKQAAQIEWSKVFAKRFMRRHGIPTAQFEVFGKDETWRSTVGNALSYAGSRLREYGMVVKADGLAKGKGVTVCNDWNEIVEAIKTTMEDRKFDTQYIPAGERIIIEEKLIGKEVSYIVMTDGKTYKELAPAGDYKRIFDGDKGPNTGGMGGYSPMIVDQPTMNGIREGVIKKALEGFRKEGIDYRGTLYAGLMLTEKGPFVLEFNARFGDPETQVTMRRMKSDLVPYLEACIGGTLDRLPDFEWDTRPAVNVVLTSQDYPGKYATGKEITGLDEVSKMDDVVVFHAGTERVGDRFYTSGGRVVNIVVLANSREEARDRLYGDIIRRIYFEGMHYRGDIAA